MPWDSYLKSNLILFGNLPFDVATLFLIKLMKSMADQTHLFTFGQITSVLTFQQIVFRIFYVRKFGLFLQVTSPEKSIYQTVSCEKNRTRTRARTLARVRCACEKAFKTCVRCACVRPFFRVCDVRSQFRTFLDKF